MNMVKTVIGLMKIMCMLFLKDNRNGGVNNVNLVGQDDINALNSTTIISINLHE
jgi:hypothetical protein